MVFSLLAAVALFFDDDISRQSAEASEFGTSSASNSQTISLLEAPLNFDPRAGRGGGEISIVQDSALLAVTGPLGSLADVAEQKSDTISLYVVRRGDSLSSIASLFNVSVNTILWANNLTRGKPIVPGQILVILPVSGVRYEVKKGDTLSLIAKRFKADPDEILSFNDLASADNLVEELTIIIPDGEASLPASPASIAARSGTRAGQPDYRGYYLRPIAGGRRTQGIHGYNGVDLATFCGAPIFAAASGDVIVARSYGWNGGYGQYMVLSHPNGTQTLYAHLNGISVGSGWHVAQGQILGYVGSTGASTGCHVHFEVRGARNPF